GQNLGPELARFRAGRRQYYHRAVIGAVRLGILPGHQRETGPTHDMPVDLNAPQSPQEQPRGLAAGREFLPFVDFRLSYRHGVSSRGLFLLVGSMMLPPANS